MHTPTTVLKQGEIFALSDDRGDISRNVSGAGVYFRDTRYLSQYICRLNGEMPELLDSSAEHNAIGVAQFANPLLRNPDDFGGQSILPHTVGLRRYREIDDGLTEQLEIRNFNEFPVRLDLELTFAADFRDIFDIRGFRRAQRGRVLLPDRSEHRIILAHQSLDGVIHQTVIHFNREPDQTTIEAGEEYTEEISELEALIPGHDRITQNRPPGHPPRVLVRFRTHLEDHSSERIEFHLTTRQVEPESPNTISRLPSVPTGSVAWHERFTNVVTSHEVVNRILDRSLRDLRSLITPFPGGTMIAAGIPWYVAPFGRDSLIVAIQKMMFSPELAIETLRFLARYQGTKVDHWTEEEPGKILHEQRFGEMARLGEVPHVPYYGTVDATPLFVILFCEVMNWTGDQAIFDEFFPAVERALSWIDRYGDSSRDGFVDYGRRSHGGLDNQNWKDSDNSLQFPDHSAVKLPIAPVEVQGYVYQAKTSLARILQTHGEPERSDELRQEAETLRQRFEERFWSEKDQFYGQAIDGSGRLVDAISSNPGHCLWSGIVTPERAQAVAKRLTNPDLNAGWGIRTLSADMPHYNPMSYHNGSIWPHDNAFIAAGLRRYGCDQEAASIASGLLAAANHFDYGRLPELFCGFSRATERYTVPISYPVSCSPQAWAAGTIPFLITTMLGLEPNAASRCLTLRPFLPDWLPEVQVRGLRFAGHEIDFIVRGHRDDTEVIPGNTGEVEILVSNEPVQSTP